MNPEATESAEEWLHMIKDYDVIAFGVGSSIVSKVIKHAQELEHPENTCRWTHLAVVVPEKFEFPGKVCGQRYIIESLVSGPLNDGVMDALTNKPKNGVQIRNLKEVLDKNHSKKEIAAFRPGPIKDGGFERFEEFWNKYSRTRYDFYHCINAVLPEKLGDCLFRSMERDDFMFCSEMVTRLYQYLGLVPTSMNCELVSPEELVRLPLFENSFILKRNRV
jgi:hypothetical protein